MTGEASVVTGEADKRRMPVRCRPAQFAEETKRADKTVPRAIILSVLVCGGLGFTYLLTILFCIQVPPPHG